MLAFHSIASVLVRRLGDFLYELKHPQRFRNVHLACGLTRLGV
jgi:hypothetical protein